MMKLKNRKEFLALKNGVIFQKYTPSITEGPLSIKGDSFDNDFWYQPIDGSLYCGDNDLDFDCIHRDGEFYDEQQYLVWEPKDVHDLIEKLKLSLKD